MNKIRQFPRRRKGSVIALVLLAMVLLSAAGMGLLSLGLKSCQTAIRIILSKLMVAFVAGNFVQVVCADFHSDASLRDVTINDPLVKYTVGKCSE